MNKFNIAIFLLFQSHFSFSESFSELAKKCAPKVDKTTMKAIVSVESAHNPYAIAIVKGAALKKQPASLEEAAAVINQLEKNNVNYSVGIAQINRGNFAKYGVSGIELLEPCLNLQISQKILQDCHARSGDIDKTLSCYYSGNFSRGFKVDYGNSSYVQRVYAKKNVSDKKEIFIPALKAMPPVAAKAVVNHSKSTVSSQKKSVPANISKSYSMLDFEKEK